MTAPHRAVSRKRSMADVFKDCCAPLVGCFRRSPPKARNQLVDKLDDKPDGGVDADVAGLKESEGLVIDPTPASDVEKDLPSIAILPATPVVDTMRPVPPPKTVSVGPRAASGKRRNPKTYVVPSGRSREPSVSSTYATVDPFPLLVLGGNDVIDVIDIPTGTSIVTFVFSHGTDGDAASLDVANHAGDNVLHHLAVSVKPGGQTAGPSGAVWVFACGAEGTVRQFEIPVGLIRGDCFVGGDVRIVRTWTPGPRPTSAEIAPAGIVKVLSLAVLGPNKLFTGSEDGAVREFDIATGDLVAEYLAHGRQPIWDMCACTELRKGDVRSRLYTGGFDGMVIEWELNCDPVGIGGGMTDARGLARQRTPLRFWRFDQGINSVAVVEIAGGGEPVKGGTPRRALLAGLAKGRIVELGLREIEDSEVRPVEGEGPVQEFEGHTSYVTAIVPMPTMNSFLTGDEDKTVRLFGLGKRGGSKIVYSDRVEGGEIYSLSAVERPWKVVFAPGPAGHVQEVFLD
ncbi:hypothetical protein HK101_011928 [Irineochytrium annulatum]|nr:hypothetical protein HK101_011928 [Irineochytrium annulatum]